MIPAPTDTEITAQDLRDEIELIREYVDRYPALRPLLDNWPGVSEDRSSVLTLGAKTPTLIPTLVLPIGIALASERERFDAYGARREIFEFRVDLIIEAFYESAESNRNYSELYLQLQKEIKGLAIDAYLAGRDFQWEQMTPSDWGRIGQYLRREWDFLGGYVNRIQRRGPDRRGMTIAEAKRDIRYYAQNVLQLYKRALQVQRGFPIAMLPRQPGELSECRVNCRCFWDWRVINAAAGDFDVSWIREPSDNCPTCLERSAGWDLLVIRNFQFEFAPEQIDLVSERG